MSRRMEIELTSSRDDGSWTWRAAGAREPRGTLESALVPSGAHVGDVLRAEIDGYLDQMSVVAVLPPRAPRREPERLELRGTGSTDTDRPLVTTTLVRERPGERRPQGRRGDRREGDDRGDKREGAGRRGRGARSDRGDRGDRREGARSGGGARRPARARQEARLARPERPAPPPVEL